MTHIKQPSPWDLHQRNKLIKHLTLKMNRAYIQENHRAVGQDSILKRLTHRPTCPRIQHKSSSLEKIPYVKLTYLLILKHLPEEERPVGTISGEGSPSKCHFYILLPSYHRHWWVPFLYFHSTSTGTHTQTHTHNCIGVSDTPGVTGDCPHIPVPLPDPERHGG